MTIKVAKANQEGEMQVPVEEIKEWVVKSATYMGSIVLIKTEDGTFSMYSDDYEKVLKTK
jgi:hypothetical protein